MANYMDYILQNPGLNLIGEITLSYLDLQSLLNCQQVSKQWKSFIEENKNVWKQQVRNCIENDLSNGLQFLQNKRFPERFEDEMKKFIEDMKAERANRERNKAIERCTVSLSHACNCFDRNCSLLSCQKMKRVIFHTRQCKRKSLGGCPICKQLIALCCYHSRKCKLKDCSVHFCERIKEKMRDAEQK